MERINIAKMDLTEEKFEAFKFLANDFTVSGGVIFHLHDENGRPKLGGPSVDLSVSGKNKDVKIRVGGYRNGTYAKFEQKFPCEMFDNMTYSQFKSSVEAAGEFEAT